MQLRTKMDWLLFEVKRSELKVTTRPKWSESLIQKLQLLAKVDGSQSETIYSLSRKNRPECFFCNIFYKTQAILMKFDAKWYKYFPPHLNNVSTLPCETWNAHQTRAKCSYWMAYRFPSVCVLVGLSVCHWDFWRSYGWFLWLECNGTQGNAVPPPLIYDSKRSPPQIVTRHTTIVRGPNLNVAFPTSVFALLPLFVRFRSNLSRQYYL